jgi:hypothetical protein
MKYRFFHIPARDPAAETEILNRFLAERRIVAVDRQFIADGSNSFWAFSVVYRDGASASDLTGVSGRSEKAEIDYREVFDERDFATFAALRTLRKDLAEAEGVPTYALFTNEQLAAWEAAWSEGLIDDLTLQRGYDAVRAITLHADSRNWRRNELARHPAPEV